MSMTSLLITGEAPPDQLTTVGFIRSVQTIDHAVTLTVTMDTTSCLTLKVTDWTRSCSQQHELSDQWSITNNKWIILVQSPQLPPSNLTSPGDPRLIPEVKLALNPRPWPETSVKNHTVIWLVVEYKSWAGPLLPVRTAGNKAKL